MPGYGRKRSYPFRATPSRLFKRTRYSRRRRFNRSRKSTSFTTQSGRGNTFGFRSRRVGGRRWKSILWRDTISQQHWRSLNAGSGTVTTGAVTTGGGIALMNALDAGGAAFWITAGGAQPNNTGSAVPLFRGDITLRGGLIGLKLNNTVAANAISAKVYLIQSFARGNVLIFPGTAAIGWDPSIVPSFRQNFRILRQWTFLIEVEGVAECKYKVPIMKIDKEEWSSDVGRRFFWLVHASSQDATNHSLNLITYFNVSFSADAIGTT